jgi:hypothetical protein
VVLRFELRFYTTGTWPELLFYCKH